MPFGHFFGQQEQESLQRSCSKPPASPLLTGSFLFWQVQAQATRTNSHRCVSPPSRVPRGRHWWHRAQPGAEELSWLPAGSRLSEGPGEFAPSQLPLRIGEPGLFYNTVLIFRVFHSRPLGVGSAELGSAPGLGPCQQSATVPHPRCSWGHRAPCPVPPGSCILPVPLAGLGAELGAPRRAEVGCLRCDAAGSRPEGQGPGAEGVPEAAGPLPHRHGGGQGRWVEVPGAGPSCPSGQWGCGGVWQRPAKLGCGEQRV